MARKGSSGKKAKSEKKAWSTLAPVAPTKAKKSSMKKKKAKTKGGPQSLYGSLPAQPSQKWKLPESMGGKVNSPNLRGKDNVLSRREQKRQKTKKIKLPVMEKRSQLSFRSPNQRFVLRMPIVKGEGLDVPWRRKRPRKEQVASNSKNAQTSIINVLSLPKASLSRLDEELEDFCKYVRLTDDEINARNSLIRKIQGMCQELFGISPSECKVFGSFASLDVCTFSSDIDLAMFGVVAPSQNDSQVEEEARKSKTQASANFATMQDADTPENGGASQTALEAESAELKRQNRILRWKAVLDEVDQKRENDVKPSPIEKSHTSDNGELSAPSRTELISSVSRSNIVQLTESTPLPESAESDAHGHPLFIIDREGYTEDTNDDFGKDAHSVTDNSKQEDETERPSDSSEETETANMLKDSGKYGSTEGEELNRAGDDENASVSFSTGDESTDSADKLESLKNRPRPGVTASVENFHAKEDVIDLTCEDDTPDMLGGARNVINLTEEEEEEVVVETRARSRSVVSLCSATTCSEADQREFDESGLEVSFVSNSASSKGNVQVPGPTGEARVLVIRALNLLSRRVRKAGLTQQVTVRKWARVPIINMITEQGCECDIAVGGFNGTDTSQFASIQCSRFKSFSTVVVLLKILLGQHGLDKPFTGGLGSFKLYVLVASHIERHLSLGGEDNAAEVLLMFLFRYGNVRKGNHNLNERLWTPLDQDTVVTNHGGQDGLGIGSADLGSVKTEDCTQVFHACFNRLHQVLANKATQTPISFLRYIIDVDILFQCRQEFLPASSRESLRGMANSASAPKRVSLDTKPRKSAGGGTEERALDTDEEAEQLAKSYGLKIGKGKRKAKSSERPGKKKKGSGRS